MEEEGENFLWSVKSDKVETSRYNTKRRISVERTSDLQRQDPRRAPAIKSIASDVHAQIDKAGVTNQANENS